MSLMRVERHEAARAPVFTKAVRARLDKGETEYGAFNDGDDDENGFEAT